MTQDERYLYLLSAQREFEWLCEALGCDDPSTRAHSMTKSLAVEISRLAELWEVRP